MVLLDANNMDLFRFKLVVFIIIFGLELDTALCSGKDAFIMNIANDEAVTASQDSSKVKILEVKRRDTDSCQKFIDGYEDRKVDSCISVGQLSPFCNKDQCPNKPSPPAKIHPIKVHLNNNTKLIDIDVTWEEPKFGLNNLCGYQLHFASLSNRLFKTCIQFNSKNKRSLTIPSLQFGSKYNITIASLPAFINIDESSRYTILNTPGKCEMYKKANLDIPWHCAITKNFDVACNNGSIDIKLEKPKGGDFDGYICMVVPGEDSSQLAIYQERYSKNQQFASFTGLPLGLKYVVQVFYMKSTTGSAVYTVSSKPFECSGHDPLVSVTACSNRSVIAHWKKITLPRHNLQYDYKVRPLRKSNNIQTHFVSGKVNESLHVSNLTYNVDYTIQVDVKLKKANGFINIGSLASDAFSCKGATTLPKTTTGPAKTDRSWLIIPGVISFILLVTIIVICVKFNLIMRAKNILMLHRRRALAQSLESVSLKERGAFSVLVVYPYGCEQIKDLVLLLGQLLDNMGCDCILDLVTDQEVQNEGDRDLFVMKKLDTLQKEDFVIFIHYEATNTATQNALNCHRRAILKKIYSNDLKAKKFISIGFDRKQKTEHAQNVYFVGNVRDELENLVRTIWGIPPYQFGQRFPEKISVQIDDYLLGEIQDKAAQIISASHESCLNSLCQKGKKIFYNIRTSLPVLNANTLLANSFDCLEFKDEDFSHKQLNQEGRSRLSSSEPLLMIL